MRNWQVMACLVALVLSSCSMSRLPAPEATFDVADSTPQLAPLIPAPALAELPPLPADGLLRTVNVTAPQMRLGIEVYGHAGNMTFGATALSLQPDADVVAYALYRFQIGAFPFDSIDFVITPNDTSRTWFGLADYNRGRWQLYQAEAGMTSLPHPGFRITSNDGFCYFVVIGYDDADTVIQQVSIDLDIPSWGEYTLDGMDHAGEALSMTRIGNFLCLAYSANDIEELKLAQATSMTPMLETDWAISQITSNTVSDAIDLERVNNLPAIAYRHSQSGTCRFARAVNSSPAGMVDWVFSFPNQSAREGFVSLAEVAGYPAVAYVDPGVMLQAVDYVYATVPDPNFASDWTTTEAVTNNLTPPFADFSHLALTSFEDLPALTYYNDDNNRLYFLRGETATPIDFNDWDAGTVDEVGAGWYNQGVQYGGLPVLVYVDQTDGALCYTGGTSWTPSTAEDWNRHCIDAGSMVNGPVSLQLLSQGLGVAYRDQADQAVKYAWVESGTPTEGMSWRVVTIAENTGDGAVSLAVQQNGQPAIAYYNSNTAALMFAWMEE